jgi:hypothetical protein
MKPDRVLYHEKNRNLLPHLQRPIASINALVAETLDKEIVMARIKKLFEIRTMGQQEEPL